MYTQTAFPVIDLRQTGRSIERHRREAGLTVRELQAYFGFEYPQAIYKWQHGECLPTVDNLLALAKLLQVSMEDLLVYEDQGVSHFWISSFRIKMSRIRFPDPGRTANILWLCSSLGCLFYGFFAGHTQSNQKRQIEGENNGIFFLLNAVDISLNAAGQTGLHVEWRKARIEGDFIPKQGGFIIRLSVVVMNMEELS